MTTEPPMGGYMTSGYLYSAHMDTLMAVRLVGMGELVKLFGLSRTRVQQLTARPDFPAPVAVLIMGSVWDFDRVQAWADATGRTLDVAAIGPDPLDAKT